MYCLTHSHMTRILMAISTPISTRAMMSILNNLRIIHISKPVLLPTAIYIYIYMCIPILHVKSRENKIKECSDVEYNFKISMMGYESNFKISMD